MKKRQWIYVALILLCAAVFVGYRAVNQLRADTEPPQISFSGPLSISVSDGEAAMFQGVTAKDDRDGNVTDSLVVESITMSDPEQPAKMIYAAFDSAGNVTKAERELTFTDYVSPRFGLSEPLIYPATNNSFDVLARVQANDVLEGDISRRIRATAMSDSSIGTLGVHEVAFRVTNALGDTAEVVLPVEVVSMESYRASLELTDYLVYLRTGATFNPRDYLYEYSMLDEEYYLRGTFPEELELKITGTVDTGTPGVYAVSYTVMGELRNTEYAAYSKLIVIVEG